VWLKAGSRFPEGMTERKAGARQQQNQIQGSFASLQDDGVKLATIKATTNDNSKGKSKKLG
jgi:hypothetical protein